MNRSIFQMCVFKPFYLVINFFKNIFNFNVFITSIIIVIFFKINIVWCKHTTVTIINSFSNFNKLKIDSSEFLATKNIILTKARYGFNNFIQLWTPNLCNFNLINFLTPNGQKFPKNHFANHSHFLFFQDLQFNFSWVFQFTHENCDLNFFQKIFNEDFNDLKRKQFIFSHIRCVDNHEFIVNRSNILLNKKKFDLINKTVNDVMIKSNLKPDFFCTLTK